MTTTSTAAISVPAAWRVEAEGVRWTGRDLGEGARRWRAALLDAGIGAHEPVAIKGPNDASTLQAILAVRLAGASVVLLHPRLTPDEALGLVRHSGARLLLASGPEANEASVPIPDPKDDLVLDVPPLVSAELPTEYLLYTSGTEGHPRGVRLSEAALLSHARLCAGRIGHGPDARWLASLTFAHAGGLALLVRCLSTVSPLVLPSAESAADPTRTIEAFDVTHLSVVPTMLRRWLAASARPAPPSLRCVLVGGAPVTPDLIREATARGFPVRATYGLTEAASQVATGTRDTPPGCAGPVLPGIRLEIRDPHGRPAPRGSVGRIAVSGPTLMAGYHGDAEATKAALVEGWLVTRDLGRLDDEGRLWVIGREGDLIITGGENVDPHEVESVIASLPGVADAGVVGRADPEWGQAIVAVVVPRPGARLDAGALKEACRGRLAPFKVPKEIRIMASLPTTATGKLRRAQLRALVGSDDTDVGEDDSA